MQSTPKLLLLAVTGLAGLGLTACGQDAAPPTNPVAQADRAPTDADPGPAEAATPLQDAPVPGDAAPPDDPSVRAPAAAPPAVDAEVERPPAERAPAPQAREARGETVAVTVSSRGFEPARVDLPVGVASQLVFTRTSEGTCATSVKAPGLGVPETALPLNEPVAVTVTPSAGGEFTFACGMDMVSGVVVAAD